jgi:hypothetical protein
MTIQGVAEQVLASSILMEFAGVDRYGMAKKCLCPNPAMNLSNMMMTKLRLWMGLKSQSE